MQNDTGLSIFDELASEDLTQVDVSFPILAAGQYEFRINSMTKETADSGYQYLLIQCATTVPGDDTNGNPVPTGYPVRHMIGLTPSDKQVAEIGLDEAKKKIKVNVVKFLQAIGNLNFDPTLEMYKDMTFYAKTRVSKERTDPKSGVTYNPQTEIASFIPMQLDA